MKTHYQDFKTEYHMPLYLKQEQYSDMRGTLCGFMRKRVTLVKKNVTCFYCRKLLDKESTVSETIMSTQLKVKFVNVGRDNKTWEAETANVTFEWLEHQVKHNGKLMSNDIDFTDDRTGEDLPVNGAFGSVIVGGLRQVGQYFIGDAISKDI